MARIAPEPYFLHQEQVQALIGPQRATSALARAADRRDPEAAAPYVLAVALAEALPFLGISELAKSAHEQTIHVGRVVGVEQEFALRRAKDRDAPGVKPVDFMAMLATDESLHVVGSFNSARTASASATGSLTGRRRVYLIGTITDLNAARIEIRPAFIGIRSFLEDNDLTPGKTTPGLRVYPSEIGQFREVDFGGRVSPAELKAVLTQNAQSGGCRNCRAGPFVPTATWLLACQHLTAARRPGRATRQGAWPARRPRYQRRGQGCEPPIRWQGYPA